MKYCSDSPIENRNEDLLERKAFSDLLAKTISQLSGIDTFTIGLFGKWGTGKTSIVNMTLQGIDEINKGNDEEIVVVHFEPWHFNSSEQLLTQFFLRLSNIFKSKKDKNLKYIGEALEKYSDAFELANFIPVVGGIVAPIGKVIGQLIGRKLQKNSSSLDIVCQKQLVVNLLKEQKHKILIVIDDMDRLNSEQIRQVFQMVSSVAKFPNTIYLLVFDKDVVVESLKEVQGGNGEEYLEKIIQIPIQIPEISNDNLNKVLFSKLDDILKSYSDLSFLSENWSKIFTYCVSPFILNLRDINRLCNSLQFKLTTIHSEVDFSDMVGISAIEIGCPQIYEWIKENKALLTGQQYDFEKKSASQWCEYYKGIIGRKIVDSNCGLEEIIDAVCNLFPYFAAKIGKSYEVRDEYKLRRENRIAHNEKFDRYFDYNIDRIKLKKSMLQDAVNIMNSDKIVDLLLDSDKENISLDALKEMQANFSSLNPKRATVLFESFIKAAAKLKTVQRKYIFSIDASSYAEELCLDLMDLMDKNERKVLLENIISHSNLEVLNSVASFINMIELGYGRLAAEGNERGYKKVITLEELLEVETVFVNRIKELLKEENLFGANDWRRVYWLLEQLDADYTRKYLETSLKDNVNVLYFLRCFISVWIGKGESYEINNKYKEFFSEERVMNVIEDELTSRRLLELDENTIKLCAAFYLNSKETTRAGGHIPEENVLDLIELWKEKGWINT